MESAWGEDSTTLPATVLRAALEDLSTETGLNFRATDAARIGNIEWLTFPAANEAEVPGVSVRVASRDEGGTKRAESMVVTIRAGALDAGDEAILRCRQESGPRSLT